MKKWNKSLMAVATAICVASAGFAGTASATGSYAESGQESGRRRDAEHIKAFVAKKRAELHDKLKLSDSQEAGWKAYTDAAAKKMTHPGRVQGDTDSMSTPERMQKQLDKMKEWLAQEEAHLGALKTFYATLTPEQQKVFDAETSPKKWRREKEAIQKARRNSGSAKKPMTAPEKN